MPAYRYEALEADGKIAAGVVESDSPRQARDALRSRGLLPVQVEAIAAQAGSDASSARNLPKLPRIPKLGRLALVLMTSQFSTLITAGLTAEQAIAALMEQSGPAERERLAAVRSDVLAGHSLASAFSSAGFPELYCALLAAGERSGRLDVVMARLAQYLQRRDESRTRALHALIYPVVVALVALAVVAALLGYVVPQLVAVFESARQVLPWPTRALLAASSFVRSTAWLWLAAVVMGMTAFGIARRSAPVWERVQRFMLRMPIVGRMMRLADTARFASSLAILSGAGVPILSALEAASRTVVALPLRRALVTVSAQVGEGAALSSALRATASFPPLLVHLVANGEATGALDGALDSAANAVESELAARSAVAVALLEPALIVGLGLFVLAVVLAVLLPVIEINQLLAPAR